MGVASSAAGERIALQGEWLAEHAAALKGVLEHKLTLMLEEREAGEALEIDMAGVTDVDPCGCQLLAVFLENLRRRGVSATPRAIPAQTMEKIVLFGFREAFGAPEPGKGEP